MAKSLILGCCSTGAKYTPNNHRNTGDATIDRISNGEDIPISAAQVRAELRQLYALGVRYYHYHARNPETAEQTTRNAVYQQVSREAQAAYPGLLLSFGASRNGPEVIDNIGRLGEWERISQADLALAEGGAHFVTMQAAIELQVIRDLEAQGPRMSLEYVDSPEFRQAVASYVPSSRSESVSMETHSTANGGNYGSSSPATQMKTYSRAIASRRRHDLCDEVEWVQFERSYAMTRLAIQRRDLALGGAGQLNVTLLFGFSPRLPFPKSYEAFRTVVAAAKRLELDPETGRRCRRVSICVGAAVLPQHAHQAIGRLDVGPERGRDVSAIARLVAYAAQADSDVDVLRVGMEDTPYLVDTAGTVRPTTNVELCQLAVTELRRNGVALVLDPDQAAARLGYAPVVATAQVA